MTAIRVVGDDDQARMRAACRQILSAHGIEVVGEAATADEAVAEVARTSPDVVLMDVRMPGRTGIEATAELAASQPAARVLVLTTFDHDEYVDGALRAGAAGFLLKNATPEALVAAVETVAAGDGVLDPTVVGRVMARFAAAPSRSDVGVGGIDRLTEREQGVLRLACRGLTNAEIAIKLLVSRRTIDTHLVNVYRKLGFSSRVALASMANEQLRDERR